MTTPAIDNDLLFKGACYFLLPEIVATFEVDVGACGVLGAAKFVCARALEARGLRAALSTFQAHIVNFAQLEPTETEALVAAEIELEAQQRGLELDVGESLLFSIVEVRKLSILATGDKRAIAAIEQIVASRCSSEWWKCRILCLEQIIIHVLANHEPARIRDRICAASFADRAVSICFGCASGSGDANVWASGLASYIADLRLSAPTVLA
jgi:hypothetical protein